MRRKRNGYALFTVVVIFAVLAIILGAVGRIASSNFLQANSQEKHIQAYYLARSGVDLAVGALLKQGPGGTNDTLLYTEFSSISRPDYRTAPHLTQALTLENGEVDITVSAFDIAGRRWVEVHAKGILQGGSSSTEVDLQFPADNPIEQKWS